MPTLHTVKINASGAPSTTFECSSRESILQAGLRAGLPLRYKCTNGSCGECRSRLLSGTIESIQVADYPLSQQQRANGWFLSCTHAPLSPLQINTPLFSDSIEIPHQITRAKVKKIDLLQPDLALLTLRTSRSNTFQFLAGQEVLLSHLLATHRYPIASCPCNGMELDFHIHRSETDLFSQLLFSSLKKGEHVTLDGPRGHFLLNTQSQRRQIFIAWEYGFASIRSLIEQHISLEKEPPISLYWLSQHPP
ncbi:MAG: 2Fe-2S iron-sulfur cluster binding domain-containing protein, partial [Gammaproteobacteria bacterium]|nr:2Fe-2S iron-sulfur cluster binding domain-containing protein [Gammaproteobacteria bacterium]